MNIGLRITVEKGNLDFTDGLSKFVVLAAQKIRSRLREKMRETKHGRRYKRKGGEGFQRFHVASAKGEAPATDTGAYEQSLKIIRRGSLEAAIETNLAYPAILEKTRPMWQPTVVELLPELENDLARLLK